MTTTSEAIRTERLYAGMYLVHTPTDTYRIHRIEGYGTGRYWLVTQEGRFGRDTEFDAPTLKQALESLDATFKPKEPTMTTTMTDRKCPTCGEMTTDQELKTCPMCGSGKRGWRTDCCQQPCSNCERHSLV